MTWAPHKPASLFTTWFNGHEIVGEGFRILNPLETAKSNPETEDTPFTPSSETLISIFKSLLLEQVELIVASKQKL